MRDGWTPLALARRAIGEFGAVQRTWELQSLIGLVRRLRPMTVVEIGTYKGGTLSCWFDAGDPRAHIVSIDLPMQGVDAGQLAASVARARTRMKLSQTFTAIAGNSRDPATRVRLETALAGASVDFLWIDGDHAYEGVRADVEIYSPLVRVGGLIALHDIHASDQFPGDGVHVYWREIARKARTREFVGRSAPGHGMGIGVVFVDSERAAAHRSATIKG